VLVAFITGVYRHGAVPQHGLRAGSGYHHMSLTIGQGIAHVPHAAVLFLRQHLQVGNCGVQNRIPVHQAFTTVDQALFIQAYEHLFDRVRQPIIHSEALMLPVQG